MKAHGTRIRTVETPVWLIRSKVRLISSGDLPYKSESAKPIVALDGLIDPVSMTGMDRILSGLGPSEGRRTTAAPADMSTRAMQYCAKLPKRRVENYPAMSNSRQRRPVLPPLRRSRVVSAP